MDAKWTLTAESVTVIVGGKTFTFQKGSPNYTAIRQAILTNRPEAILENLTVPSCIERWANGEFTVQDGKNILYQGEILPEAIAKRILTMAAAGKNPTPLFNFWKRLQKNPSYRSVEQLFPFLEHVGIPIEEDGCFLAYKAVKADYTDYFTGKTDNRPGAEPEMPRNKISDDPNKACHVGWHCGALSYAQTYGDENRRIIIVRIDPENVVCIPYDESCRKMRICKYKVIGLYGSTMPSDTIDPEDVPNMDGSSPCPEVPFDLFDKMGGPELLGEKIQDLRKYATHHLKIVGASKIPGGKGALVNSILQNRG